MRGWGSLSTASSTREREARDPMCLAQGSWISPRCSSSSNQRRHSRDFSLRLARFHPSSSQTVLASS
jgi:hypothetical protein